MQLNYKTKTPKLVAGLLSSESNEALVSNSYLKQRNSDNDNKYEMATEISNERRIDEMESGLATAVSPKETVFCGNNISLRYFIYGFSIITFYIGMSLMQENITRTKYGDGEVFTYTLTLVFLLCFVSVIFAKFMLMTFMKQGKDGTSTKYYASCALSYLGAMVASNMALIHINYPTQVVGKSCKPIPMMILGVLIGKKRYSLRKYIFVATIVIGIILFMIKEKKSTSVASDSYIGKGHILLLISLALDGFTGGIQERMKSEHKTKSGHMMYNINLWSVLILGPALIVTGELWSFLDFVNKFPHVIINLTAFSLLSALGQMFIFLMVAEFGPLPCSIVTTTRKFFTVLGSVIIFGNALTGRQWIGTFIVFTGLILDTIYGKGDISKKK